VSGALPGVGERVSYAVAGRAQRQAHDRARQAGLSFGEWRVLDVVLDLTTSYSKLADEVERSDVARRAGLSADRTGQALAKLSRLGIVFYRPGLGAGILSVVAVPREGEKADVYAAAFAAGKADAQPSPLAAGKRRRNRPEKGDALRARRRTGTEERTEKTREGDPLSRMVEQTLVDVCDDANRRSGLAELEESADAITRYLLDDWPDLSPDDGRAIVTAYAHVLRDKWLDGDGRVTPRALARHWDAAAADYPEWKQIQAL
jgi:hypothetical protein